jgi:ubiquinone/menaquinone biosynthesis C-methylase UbiE
MHDSKKILKKTQDDYNLIAGDFARARSCTWKEFDFLFEGIGVDEKVLDLGCGNGRFFEKIKGEYFGVDNSEELIKLALEKYGDFFKVGSAIDIPFDNDYFDRVYSIAMIHHIPFEYQQKVIEEIKRVLKKDGLVVLTVWNLDKKFLRDDLKKISDKEILLPWHGVPDHYFYNLNLKDLEDLLKEFKIIDKGEIKVKNISNHYIIAKKL